jgi:hypothetical protein
MRQDLINAPSRHHVAAEEHADGLSIVHNPLNSLSSQAEILRQFHISYYIFDLSSVIAGTARQAAMTDEKCNMENGK